MLNNDDAFGLLQYEEIHTEYCPKEIFRENFPHFAKKVSN